MPGHRKEAITGWLTKATIRESRRQVNFLWGGGQRKEATFSNLQLPEMPAEGAYVLTHGGAWKLREG